VPPGPVRVSRRAAGAGRPESIGDGRHDLLAADQGRERKGEVVPQRLWVALKRRAGSRVGGGGERVATSEAQEVGPLARQHLEHICQPLGDLFGGAALFGFQLAQGDGRAAHLAGELFLSQVEGAAALAEPVAEGLFRIDLAIPPFGPRSPADRMSILAPHNSTVTEDS
jgi:hypothetical protein